MIEKLKSVILTVLILASLFQSYLLAYSTPNYEPLPPSQYISSVLEGTKAELEDLLFPDQIVLHFGQQRHTVLFPDSSAYASIFESVKSRKIEGFRKVNLTQERISWEDIRDKQEGVELRFRDGIALSILQKNLNIKGSLPEESDLITRMWIYSSSDKQAAVTYFFTDSMNTAYEVLRADFTVKDVENFTAMGAMNDLFQVMSGDYYLPSKPMPVLSYEFGYKEFETEQLKSSLFADPLLTRNLKNKDGPQIFTDGKRGLQINTEERWMKYTDALAVTDSKNNISENLEAGLHFINQHGGWNGKYAISKPMQQHSYSNQTFAFRQVYDAFPIIADKREGFGTIHITLQKGVVSNYERSVVYADSKVVSKQNTELMGGEALNTRITNHPKRYNIINVFPAYRPVMGEKTIKLIPQWAIEFRDGTYELFN
ncbi:YycH family regulatory protein [Paenibacillus sp. FJAT-26967]|uniref:YycH family regulatory protein n=1 Tax=Paenibacillus sp. FJAT-26967 TaxID=1729690 RepID=UPI0008397740|nr:two-component system activity regulator YycH [Paenibacillus sp. FJAT-26967]